ncbi:MAG: DUF5131 family protein [Thermoplasmata archaeon]
MGAATGIAWTDSTWNPWRGCTKVSPGCAHCYMFREQTRYGRDPTVVTRAAPATFEAPLRWKGPRRVFTCSWSDWFHEDADPWREEAWDIIRRTPDLTYQILTKRPENISDRLPDGWGRGWPNVWLGVSGETWELARERGRRLLPVRARVKFLSAEPWLDVPAPDPHLAAGSWVGVFDWVILGGESGPSARPMTEESARSVRDASRYASAAFYLKQLGGWPDSRSHEKAILDGRTWTEMPEVPSI